MVDDASLARAYAACEALARSHYENFPVASRLLPARMRPHVAAVYAFARAADDFADEGDVLPAVRRERLDAWRARLREAASSSVRSGCHWTPTQNQLAWTVSMASMIPSGARAATRRPCPGRRTA